MKKEVKYSKMLYIRRAIEIIAVELLLSAAATALYYVGYYSTLLITFVTALIITVIYFVWTVFCLFGFRFNVHGKKTYFLANAPFYAVLFAAAIVTGFFDTEPVYTFLFMPFKVLHYAAKLWSFPGAGHMSRPVSAALMSVLFAIPLIVTPFFLSTKRKMKMRGIEIPKKKEEAENNETER